jgi:hypothetical protein
VTLAHYTSKAGLGQTHVAAKREISFVRIQCNAKFKEKGRQPAAGPWVLVG